MRAYLDVVSTVRTSALRPRSALMKAEGQGHRRNTACSPAGAAQCGAHIAREQLVSECAQQSRACFRWFGLLDVVELMTLQLL